MRIGINCLGIDPEYTGGVNSFTFGLLDGFAKNDTPHSFVLFVTNTNRFLFKKYTRQSNFKVMEVSFPSPFLVNLEWKSIKLGSARVYKIIKNTVYKEQTRFIDQHCDVLYTPTSTLFTYNSRVPNLLSIHDIQHVHFPYFFSPLYLLIRNICYALSIRHSNYIQVSSNFIREDLLSHFPRLKKQQLILIREGVDIERFSSQKKDSLILSKYNIPDNFLFYPAQLWYHKNHLTVLKALDWLTEHKQISIPLVLTGAKASASDEIFQFIRDRKMANVFYLGKIPFDDIVALYKHARFLISASMHESSCLPVLEAAAAGVPVIASDIMPNRELVDTLTLNLFPEKDHAALGNLLSDLWDNNLLRQAQINKNCTNINTYSWTRIAKDYLTFFEKII